MEFRLSTNAQSLTAVLANIVDNFLSYLALEMHALERRRKTMIRKLHYLFLLLCIPALGYSSPSLASRIKAQQSYVPVYHYENNGREVKLNMGYAQHRIHNPEAWHNPDHQKVVYEIDLVFTRYPLKKKDWITNYDTLLNDRLREIGKLDPRFLRNSFIKWHFILQTSCVTESEAKRMFHGIVLKYFYRSERTITKKVPEMKDMEKTKETILGQRTINDSTAYKIFDRYPGWKNMLVVSDWTASMYQYGAQAVLWHRQHQGDDGMKYFSFFNDGNHTPDQNKVIGNTGGIYYCPTDKVDDIINMMTMVMANGNGGDSPENDVEALIRSAAKFPQCGQLILIADNGSRVRDIDLCNQIKKPVQIILCGTKNRPINPDYIELAYVTGGSIHTENKDYKNFTALSEGNPIFIKGYKYFLRGSRVYFSRSI